MVLQWQAQQRWRGAKERESCPGIDAWRAPHRVLTGACDAPRAGSPKHGYRLLRLGSLVGGGQQRFRDGEAERFGRPHVERRLVLGRRLYWGDAVDESGGLLVPSIKSVAK